TSASTSSGQQKTSSDDSGDEPPPSTYPRIARRREPIAVERLHQRSHDAVVIERVDAVGKDATVAQVTDVMLSASDEIDARFRRRLKVAQTSGIGRDQRGGRFQYSEELFT